MEIFLNLVWFGVSLTLVAWWMKALRNGHSDARWNTVVALALLLFLLFPVISITDDLVAMTAPAETEHMLRRDEGHHLQSLAIVPLGGVALIGFALQLIGLCLIAIARIRPLSFAARLRAGSLRASGVRPPPAWAFAA